MNSQVNGGRTFELIQTRLLSGHKRMLVIGAPGGVSGVGGEGWAVNTEEGTVSLCSRPISPAHERQVLNLPSSASFSFLTSLPCIHSKMFLSI